MTGPRRVWRLDRYRDELHTIAGQIGPGPFSLLQTFASGGIKGAGFLDKDTLVSRGGPANYADALGRSHSSIKRWLADLTAVGLLVQVWKGGSLSSGKRMASRYRAVMPSDWLAHRSGDETAGQTRVTSDWHGSDQGLSDRPVSQWPPTRVTVTHLPQEVPRTVGAASPPSGPPTDGDGDDLPFDQSQFLDEVIDQVDAICGEDDEEWAEAETDKLIDRFRHFGDDSDGDNVAYMKRQGYKLIRAAKKRHETTEEVR